MCTTCVFLAAHLPPSRRWFGHHYFSLAPQSFIAFLDSVQVLPCSVIHAHMKEQQQSVLLTSCGTLPATSWILASGKQHTSHDSLSGWQMGASVPFNTLWTFFVSFYGIHCVQLIQFCFADLAFLCLYLLKLHICFQLWCWRVETDVESCLCRSPEYKVTHSLWCPLQEHSSETTYLSLSQLL